MKKCWPTIVVFLAALLFYLCFNAVLPITDPVESNYALPGKEMLLGGDWVSPHLYGRAWFDKPIMIYWLIAGSYKLFGVGEFAARFPSAVFGAASVAFIYWFAGKIYADKRIACYSALVLATSTEFWLLSRMVLTDAVLFFFSSVSLAAYSLGLRGNGRRWFVLAYVAAGLAVLTKGPIGLLLPGAIVVAYIMATRQWQLWKRLFIVRGLIICLLVAAPWYLAMYYIHGRTFIDTFLGLHNYVRATVSEHPQDNHIYYYLVLFPLSLLPWTGVFFKALLDIKQRRYAQYTVYLLVWITVTVGFYTAVATKYPTYVFPALFPAALLVGECLVRWRQQPGKTVWRWLSVSFFVYAAILAVAIAFLPGLQQWHLVYAALTIGILAVVWMQVTAKSRRLPETVAAAAALISLALIANGLIPLAQERSAKVIAGYIPATAVMIGSYGKYMTSACFYSDHVIPLLVESQPVNGEQQQEWAGKYTMPREPLRSFVMRTQTEPETYILVKSHLSHPLEQACPGNRFAPVAVYGDMTLYKRAAP